jgi:hypothetical protein
MMITLNCGWGLPGDAPKEQDRQPEIRSLTAAFGIDWTPGTPANENLPEYLYVVV